MTIKKKMQELENKKQEQLEKIRLENDMLDYFNSFEHELELEIENRELLNSVINDILKF